MTANDTSRPWKKCPVTGCWLRWASGCRPGGLELTEQLLSELAMSPKTMSWNSLQGLELLLA